MRLQHMAFRCCDTGNRCNFRFDLFVIAFEQ